MAYARCQTLSTVPTCLNLKGYAGDPLPVRFHFRDKTSHEPLDVSGDWTAQVRRSSRDTEPLDTFTVDDSGEATGLIVITLDGTQTAALPTNVGLVWDLQRFSAGSSRTFFRGDLCVIEDVTRT